jgi:hypothetical protein
MVVAFIVLAVGLALPTFAQEKDRFDPKIDQPTRLLAIKYDAARTQKIFFQ